MSKQPTYYQEKVDRAVEALRECPPPSRVRSGDRDRAQAVVVTLQDLEHYLRILAWISRFG